MLCCALIALLFAPLGFLAGRRGVARNGGAASCCTSPAPWVLALILGVVLAEMALLCLFFWTRGSASAGALFQHFCWAAGIGSKP